MTRKLELMSTDGCHLCEQAISVLQQALATAQVEVDWVEIADDDELVSRYATRIPVFVDVETRCELSWPFDIDAVQAFMSGLSASEI